MGSAGCGAAWLKSQSADWIDRMLQNRRRHPFPPSGSAPLGSLSRPPVSFRVDILRGFEFGTVPKHGVHDDGKPTRERDPCLAHRGALRDGKRPVFQF